MRGRILRPIIEIIRTGLAWCGVGTYNFNSLILVDICLVVYKSKRTFIGARWESIDFHLKEEEQQDKNDDDTTRKSCPKTYARGDHIGFRCGPNQSHILSTLLIVITGWLAHLPVQIIYLYTTSCAWEAKNTIPGGGSVQHSTRVSHIRWEMVTRR